jgi:DNA replication and repair protein RecF
MQLSHLSLSNFRSFTRLDIDLPRRIVILTGNNAQGKTSLLEAVFFLSSFTSFLTHADRFLVNFLEARKDVAVGRLVGEYKRGVSKHRLEVRLILESAGPTSRRLRKEILLDGVKRPLSEVIGHFNAVVFFPQMAQIIEGGPEERRRYLNLALAQTQHGYAQLLSNYGQVLTQRNALLKLLGERGGDQSQLEYWDETISKIGAAIIHQRVEAVHELEAIVGTIHRSLTNDKETLNIHYQPSYDPLAKPDGQRSLPLQTTIHRNGVSEEEIQSGFLSALQTNRSEEIRRGVTLIGPHRDELRFLTNGIDLSDFGSRGQERTALLALKLAEVEWIRSHNGQWPIVLLDEVLVELDQRRRKDLLDYLGKVEQAILTTTDLNLFTTDFVIKAETWLVESGMVKLKEKKA